jgi:hypothetical protein
MRPTDTNRDFVSPQELESLAAKAPETSPARHMVERAALTIRDLEGRVQDLMAALQLTRSELADLSAATTASEHTGVEMFVEAPHFAISEVIDHPEMQAAIEQVVREQVVAQLAAMQSAAV